MLVEALWALTNILSCETVYVRHVCQNNGVPLILKHMQHESSTVASQATWAIANVLGALEHTFA